MAYKHQTIDLKDSLTKEEIEYHTRILREEFTVHQSTGYWKPEGEDWQKEVSRGKYHIHPVENGFGFMVSLSESREKYRKLFTVYPKLQTAILDRSLTTGYRKHNRDVWATRKLEKLGYAVGQEKSSVGGFSGYEKRNPFSIAAEVSKCFRSSKVLEQVLETLNIIIQNRPESEYCEIVVFNPPGDGGRNNPTGRNSSERAYGLPILNIGRKKLVSVVKRKVDVNKITEIFYSLNAGETMGLSSRRLPLFKDRKSATLEDFLYNDPCHTPMVDFRCDSPEEAIHTLERLNINVTRKNVILIDSGKSFHAHFPLQILSCEEADRFLAQLKTREEVCEKWMPLQEEQGYQLLRVAPCLQKTRLPVALDL